MTAGKTTRMLEKYHRAVASLRTHRKLLSPVLIGYSKTANEPHQLSKFVKTLEGGTEWSQLKDNRGFVGTHGDIVYPCWTGNNLFNVFYRCLETKISEVRALLKGHENPSEILCNFEPALKEIIWSTTLPDTEDFADAMLLSYAATMIGVVGIDEGQFFGELKPFCQVLRYWGIKVYVSGLNADWTLNHWESIAELEAVCDDVTFLKAICVSCGSEEAVVSKKLITTSEDSKVREDIGGTDKYIPVCMKCYHNYAQ